MPCCYIAASLIASIINTCDALNIDMNLQYDKTLDPSDKFNHADDDVFPTEERSGPTAILICAACTCSGETALLSFAGVQRAMTSLPFQEARVADVSKDAMISVIEGAGYNAEEHLPSGSKLYTRVKS